MKVLVIDDNTETTDMLSVHFESVGDDFKAINDGKKVWKPYDRKNRLLDKVGPRPIQIVSRCLLTLAGGQIFCKFVLNKISIIYL